MYGVVRASNWGSSVFFVAWIVVGKYILLTLFLAVTLEAFEAKYDTQVRVRQAGRQAVGLAVSRAGKR
mgnify:CR=1 FL=1